MLAAAPAAASAAAPGYRTCGKVDIGFTNARVSARQVGCADARSLVRRWQRAIARMRCVRSNDFCAVVPVRRFRCVRGGSDYTVRLRCTRGEQRVRAYWGD
jgi:hypothetical protein